MARTQINKNLVVSLTLFAFAMAVVTALLVLRRIQQRDPAYFVEIAQRYEQGGEWQNAAVFYKKAWDRSQDAAYLVPLGDVLLQHGDVSAALAAWQTALVAQPDLSAAHLRFLDTVLEFAKLYGRASDWGRVREAAETFLSAQAERSPAEEAKARHGLGLALLATARTGDGAGERAEQELLAAVNADPETVDYSLDLAQACLQHGREDDARQVFEGLLARHGSPGANACKVRLAWARRLVAARRYDEADEAFQQSLALAEATPDALRDARLGYALYLAQRWARGVRESSAAEPSQPLFEQAEALLRQTIEADPEHYDAFVQLAALYGAARRHADVERVCDQRLQRGLSRKGLQAARNRLSAFTLMMYAAEACVAEGVTARLAERPQEIDTWLEKADRYVAQGAGELPTHPRLHSQRGRLLLARGLEREALAALRAAQDAYREMETVSWENTVTLARLHLKLKEAGAAKAVLDEVTGVAERERPAEANFWILYAQILFENSDLDRALAICEQVLLTESRHADALRLKAAIFERQGRAEDAGRVFEQLTGDQVVRAILSARQLILDGRTDAGVTTLRNALQETPSDPRLVGAAFRELTNLGREAEARAVVDRALSIAPDDPQLQRIGVLTRRDLTVEQRDQAMLRIIEQEEDGFQRSLSLIGFYLTKSDCRQALPAIDAAMKHLAAKDTSAARTADSGQALGLLHTKMSCAATLKDAEAMASARDEAAHRNVDGVAGRSILGLYHMFREEHDLAIKALEETIAAQPTDSRSLAHLGRCLHAVGRTEEARAAYDAAVRVNPAEGLAFRGLAFLAKSQGDEATYETAITACERLIPDEAWVREELLFRRERADPGAAIQRREKLLAEKPDDVQNLERLAGLYERTGDHAKADRCYERWVSLNSTDKEAVTAAASYFRRTGRPDRAHQALQRFVEVQTEAPARAGALLLLAKSLWDRGEKAPAERALLDAAALTESFEVAQTLAEFYLRFAGEPAKALPWFDKASQRAREKSLPQLPQTLAGRVRCLLSPPVDDVPAASAAIEELASAFPEFTPVWLLRSELEARNGRIDRAVDALTEFLHRRPDDPHALYQRAIHFITLGRPSDAVADLEAVKRISPSAFQGEPRLLLARLHLLAGRRDRWLNELESLAAEAGDAVRPIEEVLRAYLAEQRIADAERLATSQVNRLSDRPDPRWFLWRGQIALITGETDSALADFRRAAEISGFTAESVVQVLGAYVHVNRAPQGLDFFERYANQSKPSSALTSRHAVLLHKAGRPQEAALEFVRAMQAALNDSAAIRAALAFDLQAAYASEPIDRIAAMFDALSVDEGQQRSRERIHVELLRIARRPGDAATRLEAWMSGTTQSAERAEILSLLGDLWVDAGEVDRARRAYEEALSLAGDNWLILNNLAYVLSDRLGENERARPHAERAVALADNPDTLDTLGWICAGMGDYPRAIAELSRALRTNPGHVLATYHLGETYRRSGQFREAADVLESARLIAAQSAPLELRDAIQTALKRTAASETEP